MGLEGTEGVWITRGAKRREGPESLQWYRKAAFRAVSSRFSPLVVRNLCGSGSSVPYFPLLFARIAVRTRSGLNGTSWMSTPIAS